MNFIQPPIPVADIMAVESVSAITIAQRIPIKKTAHFLTGAKSMDTFGVQTMKTSIHHISWNLYPVKKSEPFRRDY